MQWVRVRARVRVSVSVSVRVTDLRLGLELVLVAPFQKHFVGIAVVGITACRPTRNFAPLPATVRVLYLTLKHRSRLWNIKL